MVEEIADNVLNASVMNKRFATLILRSFNLTTGGPTAGAFTQTRLLGGGSGRSY